MCNISIELAGYILENYYTLLSLTDEATLRVRKLSVATIAHGSDKEFYLRRYWISDDAEVLNHLDPAYVQFVLNTASKLLEEHADEIYLNRCPVCKKLARTPLARQCRLCGHDWH